MTSDYKANTNDLSTPHDTHLNIIESPDTFSCTRISPDKFLYYLPLELNGQTIVHQ